MKINRSWSIRESAQLTTQQVMPRDTLMPLVNLVNSFSSIKTFTYLSLYVGLYPVCVLGTTI